MNSRTAKRESPAPKKLHDFGPVSRMSSRDGIAWAANFEMEPTHQRSWAIMSPRRAAQAARWADELRNLAHNSQRRATRFHSTTVYPHGSSTAHVLTCRPCG